MEENLNSQEISAFKRGDQKIFKKVFDLYYPALLLFINKLIDNREEAEDIALRAFQSLFNKCKGFDTEVNIKAYLYVTGRNSSLNYINAKVRREKWLKKIAILVSREFDSLVDYNLNPDLLPAVYSAIEELPDGCRRVFEMLYYEELAPEEIAAKLNISVSTVYNQKSRAIKVLRLKLAEMRSL